MVSSLHEQYGASTRKKGMVLVLLLAVLLLLVVYAAMAGTVKVSLRDIIWSFTGHSEADAMTSYILQQVRFPRIVMAVLTGMSLAIAGVIMQAILRNPLASPFTLGVSSGASFGAALAIVLGASLFGIEQVIRSARWLIAANAFLFGCLAVFFVYGIARLKNSSTTVLLLAGVAIGHLFSSGVSALKYFSNNEALKDLVVWLMGGFWGANWEVIKLLAPCIALVFILLMAYAWDLNVLGMGEEVAKTAGVKVRQMRLVTLLAVTFIASATIAFSGVIGFIGLVAPHISRMLIGVDHRYLLPASCLSGAILLLASDTLARTIISPVEIPVGIITSIIGAPFFIYLLVRKRRDYWN
ncbi:FecCD family ABC transporter permease [Paenibacillus senegalensis]|uniref:FecCD family ABC transporter permease n=1 Tax=Paenibacillus senegalensis TaxID=1465766 RepID=UPI000287E999|nr:iron ABC transporter permease [Paenibacillus senegalensis]